MNTEQEKDLELQALAYALLTADQKAIYDEAVYWGACHEDAIDAVLCNETIDSVLSRQQWGQDLHKQLHQQRLEIAILYYQQQQLQQRNARKK